VVGSASSFGALDGQAKLEVIVAVVELALAVILVAKADVFARMITNEAEPSPVKPDGL
jgi:hypothetical protein